MAWARRAGSMAGLAVHGHGLAVARSWPRWLTMAGNGHGLVQAKPEHGGSGWPCTGPGHSHARGPPPTHPEAGSSHHPPRSWIISPPGPTPQTGPSHHRGPDHLTTGVHPPKTAPSHHRGRPQKLQHLTTGASIEYNLISFRNQIRTCFWKPIPCWPLARVGKG